MHKPKMRPITIEVYAGSSRMIMIEALTPEAEEWMKEHVAEFGELIKHTGSNKIWTLFVHKGYQRAEVGDYLNHLWDSQHWPVELEETTSAAATTPTRE